MNQTDLVEDILRGNEDARNSDGVLIIELLNRRGANLTPHQEQLIRGIVFESITRCRRIFQNKLKKYVADPNVARERRVKGYQMQQRMPKAKPSEVEQIINGAHTAFPDLNQGKLV